MITTGLNRDDLRAAVGAGMITEAQAASLTALAQDRAGTRSTLGPQEEPFELFKGFNEIFIVVGLSILYLGWVGLTGLEMIGALGAAGATAAAYAAVAMAALVFAARYFTLNRRMVAPSIALTVMFALSALQLGATLGWELGLNWTERAAFTAGTATLSMVLWYWLYRIPFAVALIAIGAFASVGAVFVHQGAGLPAIDDLFLLSNNGPFAWITVVMGLIGLAAAMWFDMSDPHRVTRRAASGFWLHVVSAPAIINTVALTLFETGAGAAYAALLAFIVAMALFAIAIDRRSFLVSGVGYVVALAFVVLEGGAAAGIFVLGAGLVLLGAQWERLRRGLMRALPAFPGKDRLPPYDLIETQEKEDIA